MAGFTLQVLASQAQRLGHLILRCGGQRDHRPAQASRLPRYRHYADRFRRSLDRVDSGQVEYVTSPTVDSLHNIWFEFHEDILALLGRPRETVGG